MAHLIVVHADRLARWRRAAAPSRVPINPALDFDPDAGRPGVRDQDGAAEGRPCWGERPKEALIRGDGVVHEHDLAAQGGTRGFRERFEARELCRCARRRLDSP